MNIRDRNTNLVGPGPRACVAPQDKAISAQSMVAVGLRCFRTLSGVPQKRPRQQRPPLPQAATVSSTEGSIPPIPLISSSEKKQEPEPAFSSIQLGNSPRFIHSNDPGPFSPCVSHLQGIHFLPDANQDPDLDADESTTSWPQSVRDETSFEISTAEDPAKRLSCRSHSFSVNWSDQCLSPSLVSITPSEHSSMSNSSLTSRISDKIPINLLSVQACHTASPPIDCESPYAPYAPTSPLSANITSHPQPRVPDTSTIPFSILSALRSTLPSKIIKAKVKATMLQQPQAIQDRKLTCESSGLEFCPSSSSMKLASPQSFSAVDSIPLAPSGRESKLDHSSSPNFGSVLRVSGSASRPNDKSECRTPNPRHPGKVDHQRRHSTSPGVPSSIPFPGSGQNEEVAESQSERKRSHSSTSHFRNQLNNFWSHPINRFRTSSSLSTVLRGIKPRKRGPPSDDSFEPRPFTMCTDSSYEILNVLDSSAAPTK